MAETYNAATNTRTATFKRPKKVDYGVALQGAINQNRTTLAGRYDAKGNTTAAANLRALIASSQGGTATLLPKGRPASGNAGYNYRQPTTPAVTPTTPTTPAATGLSPQDIAAQKLALALRGQGMDWNYTQGQPYAPPASLVGGTAWRRIQNMPSLFTLMLQARQASGQPQPDYLSEIGLFQHAAPSYQQVSYGW